MFFLEAPQQEVFSHYYFDFVSVQIDVTSLIKSPYDFATHHHLAY